MSSFKNYKRTISTGKAGSGVTVTVNGTGFALCGESSECTLTVTVDGEDITSDFNVPKSGPREQT